MRRLIEPCLSSANARCGNEQMNGMNLQHAQQSRRLSSCVFMSGFGAGMELNPQILGEEWPILLENIQIRKKINDCLRTKTASVRTYRDKVDMTPFIIVGSRSHFSLATISVLFSPKKKNWKSVFDDS